METMSLALDERWPLRLAFQVSGFGIVEDIWRDLYNARVEKHRPTNGGVVLLREAWCGDCGQVTYGVFEHQGGLRGQGGGFGGEGASGRCS